MRVAAELDLPRGGVGGGWRRCVAPYRVEQSVGHLLGPISILLPVSLWAFERRGAAIAGGPHSPVALGPEDDRAGGSDVVVLAHAFWQSRFAGRATVVSGWAREPGRSLRSAPAW